MDGKRAVSRGEQGKLIIVARLKAVRIVDSRADAPLRGDFRLARRLVTVRRDFRTDFSAKNEKGTSRKYAQYLPA